MWRSALWGAALAVIAGCAPKQVESPLEKAPPVGIAEARDMAATGDIGGAQRAYEAFIIGHPGTVDADLARLELGVLDADIGRCQDAVQHLTQAQDSASRAIALHASLHLSACQLALGDPERALSTLAPIAAERFPAEEEALLWDTTLIACEQTTNGVLGLRVLDARRAVADEPPDPQRVWETAELLAQRITVEEAAVLYAELRPGMAPHAAVAMRRLRDALGAQDGETVAATADALRDSEAMAIPAVAVLVARADELLHGNPYAVGALLPLSGRGREVGQQLLQGMQLAQLEEGGPELVVQDTGGDLAKTEAAIDTLVGDRGVIAVLGPVGVRTTQAAAASTRRAGVPLISFSASDDVTRAGDEVFRLLYSPRDELSALVREARARQLTRFIVLYPDHGYGRTMERLFDQEVAAAGGVACEGVAYPPGTKSFVEYVRTALASTCDTVLVADVADQVASIAPTFAAEGAWSLLGGALPEHVERRVHFLLPSPSWSPMLLRRAQRYLQGALIALPFYEGGETPLNEHFRSAYEARYGRAPQTFSAYGYDAYRIVSATLRQGHQTREALSAALRAGSSAPSVTSVTALSNDRIPAAPPQVYRVTGDRLMPVE